MGNIALLMEERYATVHVRHIMVKQAELILSPWLYDGGKRHISRADCVALNTMAEEICADLCDPNG